MSTAVQITALICVTIIALACIGSNDKDDKEEK